MKKLLRFLSFCLLLPFHLYRMFRAIKRIEAEDHFAKQYVQLEYQNILLSDFLRQSPASNLHLPARSPKLIVSLTSYPARIHATAFVIHAIMRQSLLADEIVLYLTKEEFPDAGSIPDNLLQLQKRGLQIKFCKNVYSYNKIMPTLKDYPEDIIVTIDDDHLYPFQLLEHLYREHLAAPEHIIFSRGYSICFNADDTLQEYTQWSQASSKPSMLNFPTGVGGVLYPPHSLSPDVGNEAEFLQKYKTCDDIWLKAMSLKQGTQCKRLKQDLQATQYQLQELSDNETALQNTNNVLGPKYSPNGLAAKQIFTEYNLLNGLLAQYKSSKG